MRQKRHEPNARNADTLKGALAQKGFELWRHFFWATETETGERRAFRVEYLLMSPKAKKVDKKGALDTAGFAMVRAGILGKGAKNVAEFFPIKETKLSSKTLSLKFGDNVCLETGTKGNLVSYSPKNGPGSDLSDSGSVSWELRIEKRFDYGQGFAASAMARSINMGSLYWHVGALQARVEGRIIVDGVEYNVRFADSNGYQDKIWGTKYGDGLLKIFGGRLVRCMDGDCADRNAFLLYRIEPFLFGQSLGLKYHVALVCEGKLYDFSYTGGDTQHQVTEVDEDGIKLLRVEAFNSDFKMVADITCPLDSLSPISYPLPKQDRALFRSSSAGSGAIKLYKSGPFLSWELIESLYLTDAGFECV